MSADLQQRAEQMAPAAIGKSFKVRMDKTRTISGTIVECRFARLKYTQSRTTAIWQVVLKHEATGSRHIVHVARIPQ